MLETAAPTGLYPLWPKQAEAMWLLGLNPGHPPPDNLPVNDLLYGGAAGGGKSYLIRALMVTLSEIWPGSRLAIFRKRFTELIQNHVYPMLSEVPDDFGTFNWTRMEFRRPNGSVIEFHHCEQDADYLNYKGFEWDSVALEEATEFSELAAAFITSRCRSTKPGWRRIVLAATNPGGRSHLFWKRGWVDASIRPGVPFWGPPLPPTDIRHRRCFLPAKLKDNLSLPYEETLAGMVSIPDLNLRRALADGDWSLPAGQFFTTADRAIHVVPAGFEIPPDWPRWRAYDWGYSPSPAFCLWFASDPTTRYPRTYVYREWVRTQVITQLQAHIICQLSTGERYRGTFADPMIWKRTGNSVGETYQMELAAGGLLDLIKANNQRKPGLARIRRALAWDPGSPAELQILETCPTLLTQLFNVEYDPDDPEDIRQPRNDTDLRDDGIDTLRYGLMGAYTANQDRPTARRYRVGRTPRESARIPR